MAGKVKANVEKYLRYIFKDILVLVIVVSNAHDLGGHGELNEKIKLLKHFLFYLRSSNLIGQLQRSVC